VSSPPGGLSAYRQCIEMSCQRDRLRGSPPTQPVTVTFSSTVLPAKVTPDDIRDDAAQWNGAGTLTDAGCAPTAPVDVTSLRRSTPTRSPALRINPPTSGSLRFEFGHPSSRSITLRGRAAWDGQSRDPVLPPWSTLAGNGVPNANVCFGRNDLVGGSTSTDSIPTRCRRPGTRGAVRADNVLRYVKRTQEDGTVTVQVNSGTTPTPVSGFRGTHALPRQLRHRLQTVSDSLSISTGLALQSSFDVSISSSNIEVATSADRQPRSRRAWRLLRQPGADARWSTSSLPRRGVHRAERSRSTVNGVCSCTLTARGSFRAGRRPLWCCLRVGLED